MARRGAGGRGRPPSRPNPARKPASDSPAAPRTEPIVGTAGLLAWVGLALGGMAVIALPIAYQWTFRPTSRPPGSDALVPLLELGGILAAIAALLLGRRARAAGDRSPGAVWAPRLGGAAIVGYAMTVVILVSRG